MKDKLNYKLYCKIRAFNDGALTYKDIITDWNKRMNNGILTNVANFDLDFCKDDILRVRYYELLMNYHENTINPRTGATDWDGVYDDTYLDRFLLHMQESSIVAHLLNVELNILDDFKVDYSETLSLNFNKEKREYWHHINTVNEYIDARMGNLYPRAAIDRYRENVKTEEKLEAIAKSLAAIKVNNK